MSARSEPEEALMREMLLAAIEPPPPGLTERVLARVEWADQRRDAGGTWGLSLVASALAAALVVTLALGMRLAHRSGVPAAQGTTVTVAPAAAVPIRGTAARLFLTSAAAGVLAEQAGAGPAARTTLYQTADGGRTWAARLAYDGSLPGQLVIDPSGAGVVVAGQRAEAAADLVLYRTLDGGATWQRVAAPAGVTAWGVPYFVDGRQGWVLASLGPARAEMLSTSDGGRTWSASPPFNDRANFPGLSSVRLRIVWASGGRAIVVPPPGAATVPVHVFLTEDGGATWRSSFPQAPVSAASALLDARLLPDGRAVLFLQPVDGQGRGTGLSAYVSRDAGRTWAPAVAVDGPASSRALFALDEGHWWTSSGSGADLVATDDGGRTLRRRRSVLPAGYAFQSIGFSSPREGWAVAVAGSRTAVFLTHDGGADWQPLAPPD